MFAEYSNEFLLRGTLLPDLTNAIQKDLKVIISNN